MPRGRDQKTGSWLTVRKGCARAHANPSGCAKKEVCREGTFAKAAGWPVGRAPRRAQESSSSYSARQTPGSSSWTEEASCGRCLQPVQPSPRARSCLCARRKPRRSGTGWPLRPVKPIFRRRMPRRRNAAAGVVEETADVAGAGIPSGAVAAAAAAGGSVAAASGAGAGGAGAAAIAVPCAAAGGSAAAGGADRV